MSLSEALLVICPIAGISIVIAVYSSYMKAQLFRLARYEEWSDRFYSAAKPLIQNPETPDQIIGLIGNLNDLITERVAPLAMYRVFLGHITQQPDREEKKSDPKLKAFFGKHPKLASNVEGVAHAGLLAASYTSIMGGVHARAVLADALFDMDTQVFAAAATQDVRAVSENAANRRSSLVPIISGR